MTAPVPQLQPSIDLVQDLRMDAEMLKDGHQENLTKLWHSDVVKNAAANALLAADAIASLKADNEGLRKALNAVSVPAGVKKMKARIEELESALRFYADGRRYQGANQRPIPDDPYAKPDSVYINDVTRDLGAIARAALSPSTPAVTG